MEIDEARKDQSSRGIDLRGAGGSREMRPDRDNVAFFDQHIRHAIEASGIDHMTACRC